MVSACLAPTAVDLATVTAVTLSTNIANWISLCRGCQPGRQGSVDHHDFTLQSQKLLYDTCHISRRTIRLRRLPRPKFMEDRLGSGRNVRNAATTSETGISMLP